MWWVLAGVIIAGELRICFWIDTPYRARNAFLLGMLAMVPLAFVPPIRGVLGAILDRLCEPSRRTRRLAFFAILTVFAAWGYAQGVRSDRAPYPLLHDEHSYLLQAQHLASLRLWMPQHPLADFFESFHILVKPVYSSIYWPGTALMNVPAIWLDLPEWVIPVLLYGAVLGVTYLIVTESAGGAAGVVAVLIAGSQPHLVAFAMGVMAQMPAAVLGAAMLWAWLRWRSAPDSWRRLAWTGCIGALAGWMAITRPADALAFAVPVGVAMLANLLHPSRPRRLKAVTATILVGVAAALPFLAAQALLNHGTTRSILTPPYNTYLAVNQPGTQYGASVEASADPRRPQSKLPQQQELYENWLLPKVLEFNEQSTLSTLLRRRIPDTLRGTLPSLWLLPFTFGGMLLALRLVPMPRTLVEQYPALRPLAGVALSAVVLFLCLYCLNPFYQDYYPLPLVVPITLLTIAGACGVAGLVPRVRTVLVQTLAGATLAGFAMHAWLYPNATPFPWMARKDDLTLKYIWLPEKIGYQRALVIVRYGAAGAKDPYFWEPVYTTDAAWPDDAHMIWAHDLPGRNRQIVGYYADLQPQRLLLFWDRSTGTVDNLGSVGRFASDPAAVDRFIPAPPDAESTIAPAMSETDNDS